MEILRSWLMPRADCNHFLGESENSFGLLWTNMRFVASPSQTTQGGESAPIQILNCYIQTPLQGLLV